MEKLILVKYGEIHLKGDNRPFFEKLLVRNIKNVLPDIQVEKGQGRYFIRGFKDIDKAIDRLTKVFGIHAMSIAYSMDKNLDEISSFGAELIKGEMHKGNTFKVKASRADKSFSMESPKIAALIGGNIYNSIEGLEVDVKNPKIILNVEIREKAYVYIDNIKGAGGMPVGSGGKAMILLSGGIDSPVAGWMLAKRGIQLNAVHFYSFPYTGEQAKQKVLDLAKIMSNYCGPIKMLVVPFTNIQEQIYKRCPETMLTIIMRRLMMQIAERLAVNTECSALITGESLGQVASQTIDSLVATDNCVKMPVFRPLIGFDKQEIVEIAMKIGTFETSILPYEDCCTVFTPKHPSTHPNLEKVIEAEQILDVENLISEAVSNTETIIIKPE